MLQRCTNPKAINFGRYGGKGVKVCERWMKFEKFLADMGERPMGMTLDRKDSAKDYCASNCRWATAGQQAKNRRIKLTGREVHQIRWLVEMGYRQSRVARMFEVAPSTVCDILKGRTWQ